MNKYFPARESAYLELSFRPEIDVLRQTLHHENNDRSNQSEYTC